MMDHKLTKARKAPTYHNLFKICATPPVSHCNLWPDLDEQPASILHVGET